LDTAITQVEEFGRDIALPKSLFHVILVRVDLLLDPSIDRDMADAL
jgi:hypothetical protein